MKTLITFFAALLLFSSCNKYPCKDDNTGSIRFKNSTNHNINVHINGSLKHTIVPNDYAISELSVGTYTVNAFQVGTNYYWPQITPEVVQCNQTPINFQ